MSGSLSVARAMQSALQNRDDVNTRLSDQSPKDAHVRGRVQLNGAGETHSEVSFPIKFVDEPIFTYGGSMGDNQSAGTGGVPTAAATVMEWITLVRPGNRKYYIGARLGIVTTGPSDMQYLLHYEFKGDAFREPTADPPTPQETL